MNVYEFRFTYFNFTLIIHYQSLLEFHFQSPNENKENDLEVDLSLHQ